MDAINIHNYEAYLLDYSEGTLTDEKKVELEVFLMLHPELKVDLSELAFTPIHDEKVEFLNKNSLKKTANDLVTEEQLIGYIENQLTKPEKDFIDKSIKENPTLNKELQLFQSTIITADTSIQYPNKEELKRKPKVIWFDFSFKQFAAAASVALLIGAFFIWKNNHKTESTSVIAVKSNFVDSTSNSSETKKPKDLNKTVTPIANNKILNNEKQNHNSKNKKKLFAPGLNNTIANTNNQDTLVDKLVNSIDTLNETKKQVSNTNNQVAVQSKPKTVIEVISETEDEAKTSTKKQKKGIWSIASNALNKLNTLGVKSVNGEEKNANTLYAITLGGVSLQHRASN